MNNTVVMESRGRHPHVSGAEEKLIFHSHNQSLLSTTYNPSIWWYPVPKRDDQVKYIHVCSSTGVGVFGANMWKGQLEISVTYANIINVTASVFVVSSTSYRLFVYKSVILSVPSGSSGATSFIDCYTFNPAVEYTTHSFKIMADGDCVISSQEFTGTKGSRVTYIWFLAFVLCCP